MDAKTPLLSSDDDSKHIRRNRRNSVTSLRCDFFSKLPEKVRRGLDPEAPFQVDLSKTIGLIEGKQKKELQIHLFFSSNFFLFLRFITSLIHSGEKEYYEKQFAALKSFEEVDCLRATPNDINTEEEDLIEEAQHERAINISNWANIFLLALKVNKNF